MGANSEINNEGMERLLSENFTEAIPLGHRKDFEQRLRNKLVKEEPKNGFKLVWLLPLGVITLVLLLFINLKPVLTTPENDIDQTVSEIDKTILVLEDYDQLFVETDKEIATLPDL